MRITKTALLGAIDTALANVESETIVWNDAVKLWREEREAEWMANKMPQWLKLRDLITSHAKRGKPITSGVLDLALKARRGYSSSYWSEHVFSADTEPSSPITVAGRKVYKPSQVPVGDLRALKVFLEAADDDSFTLESLSRMGFKAPAFVFRAAASSGGA